ncbi:MAG: mannitol 2-dehydrogenase [Glaciecola sp.]|jgi:mannitol 2-dehydrogenase
MSNDPVWGSLVATAELARQNPRAWIEQKHIYGDLVGQADFVRTFERCLRLIWQCGVESALAEYGGVSFEKLYRCVDKLTRPDR